MDLYIYNEQVELVGVTDAYTSLIWIRRYRSAGSFEFYAPLTAELAALITPRRYIYRSDVGEAMYISGVMEEHNGGSGRFLRAVGYSLDGLLRKRSIMTDGKAVGIIDEVKAILEATPLGVPTNCKASELDTVTRKTERAAVLEDWVRESCVIGDRDISYQMQLLPAVKKLSMILYDGRDLSDTVVFGDAWGNLSNMQYAYSEDGCANVIICKCGAVSESNVEGDPKGIPSYTLGDAVGLARTESIIITEPVVKDGIRTVYDADGVPSFEEYRYLSYDDTLAKMQEEAAAAYADYTESYSADALGSGYRSEWDAGDKVTVVNGLRNTAYIKRIEEVQEVFDTSGAKVTPTFGEPLKTILDLIKG